MVEQRARRRLTIFISESDQWRHHPLYAEIAHRAHQAGLAGATVIHGIEGFGVSHRVRTTRLLSLAEDSPGMVVIVDHPDRIDAFLPQIDELIADGLAVLDDVKAAQYPSDVGEDR